MTLRRRLIFYSGILLLSLAVVSGLSLYSAYRYRQIQNTLSLGLELQIKSREVMSLMKDIVFEVFSPQLYGHVRSLTYSPRSSVTLRQWMESVDAYNEAFNEFMDNPMFFLNGGNELRDQYEIAARMNSTALAKLNRMEDILFTMQALKNEEENLYNHMQKDETLIPFFNEIQETSYYFTNSFESFINYFIDSYREHGKQLQKRTLIINIVLAALVAAGTMAAIYIFSRDLLNRIRGLESAFTRVSQGDFSHPLNPRQDDELGELGRRFDELSLSLKENVESILELTRNIGAALEEEITEEALQELIVQALIRDTAADTTGFYVVEPGETPRLAAVNEEHGKDAVFPLNQADSEALIVSTAVNSREVIEIRNTADPGRRFPAINLAEQNIHSLVAIPLILGGRCEAVLVSMITLSNREFTDFGITRMVTFSEFASLTIDHHRRYAEILEKGKAEYQALQSQVQPHFINNVMSALFALNRKGEREILESSILSFRKMLRYVQDGRRDTTIAEEFDFLREYLELQKLRFGERLNYSLILREGTGNIVIPRLLLQPLVENSVIHGLEPLDRTGHLIAESSWSYREDSRILEIEIKDNGAGLPPEVIQGGGRIGLPNVKARLRLTYPGARFSVMSQEGEGTRIRMEISNPVVHNSGEVS